MSRKTQLSNDSHMPPMDANLFNHYCSVGISFARMIFHEEPMETDMVDEPMDVDNDEKPMETNIMNGHRPANMSMLPMNMDFQNPMYYDF